ncbi:ubiquitin-like protease [Anaeramoeba flamelloides]|uniref:Ubiquitin-like protease n=1 Tax=Anaeramoeba flamelloides TaxID=1746091 RepID=A0AAV7YUR4_9EUKA|nr:ubiquitin-like protease [Anaeramoeba flamelloides]
MFNFGLSNKKKRLKNTTTEQASNSPINISCEEEDGVKEISNKQDEYNLLSQRKRSNRSFPKTTHKKKKLNNFKKIKMIDYYEISDNENQILGNLEQKEIEVISEKLIQPDVIKLQSLILYLDQINKNSKTKFYSNALLSPSAINISILDPMKRNYEIKCENILDLKISNEKKPIFEINTNYQKSPFKFYLILTNKNNFSFIQQYIKNFYKTKSFLNQKDHIWNNNFQTINSNYNNKSDSAAQGNEKEKENVKEKKNVKEKEKEKEKEKKMVKEKEKEKEKDKEKEIYIEDEIFNKKQKKEIDPEIEIINEDENDFNVKKALNNENAKFISSSKQPILILSNSNNNLVPNNSINLKIKQKETLNKNGQEKDQETEIEIISEKKSGIEKNKILDEKVDMEMKKKEERERLIGRDNREIQIINQNKILKERDPIENEIEFLFQKEHEEKVKGNGVHKIQNEVKEGPNNQQILNQKEQTISTKEKTPNFREIETIAETETGNMNKNEPENNQEIEIEIISEKKSAIEKNKILDKKVEVEEKEKKSVKLKEIAEEEEEETEEDTCENQKEKEEEKEKEKVKRKERGAERVERKEEKKEEEREKGEEEEKEKENKKIKEMEKEKEKEMEKEKEKEKEKERETGMGNKKEINKENTNNGFLNHVDSRGIIITQIKQPNQENIFEINKDFEALWKQDLKICYPISKTLRKEFGSVTIEYQDYLSLNENSFLSDSIINFYLKYLYFEIIPENERERFQLFNSFFQTKLKEIVYNPQERNRWTKKINLMQKDFWVIPINSNCHWFLVVICYPLKTQFTTVLVFDSLFKSEKKDLIHLLTQFLMFQRFSIKRRKRRERGKERKKNKQTVQESIDSEDEVQSEIINGTLEHQNVNDNNHSSNEDDNDDKNEDKDDIDITNYEELLFIPIYCKTPQQTNGSDCGIFLLEIAQRFCTNIPQKKVFREKDFNATTTKWFQPINPSQNRLKIKSILIDLLSKYTLL